MCRVPITTTRSLRVSPPASSFTRCPAPFPVIPRPRLQPATPQNVRRPRARSIPRLRWRRLLRRRKTHRYNLHSPINPTPPRPLTPRDSRPSVTRTSPAPPPPNTSSFDTIKVRLQTNPKFAGPIDCLKQTLRNEGFRGVYKGASPPLVGWMFMDSLYAS